MQLRNLAEVEPAVGVWGTPDLTLIDNGRRPAVPMPGELFGPSWSIIEDVADVTATAPDYAAVAYLAAAASLIGGKRWVEPYGGWKEPAIIWACALGEPSSRKSAPLAKMTSPLWDIARDARVDHEDALRAWQAEAERAKFERAKWQDDVRATAGTQGGTPALPPCAVEPEKPQERRTIISDVTPEAAASVLCANPQGVLCFNDELQGWIDSFDKYNSGGAAFWLSAFGGKPHDVTRKGSGSLHVKFNGISVLGSMRPDVLAPLLAGANNGLVPRIIFAWPEKMAPPIPTRRADLDALETAYRRLDALPWATDANGERAPIVVPLATDAVATFHSWEVANAASEDGAGSLYQAFAGKLSGLVARLALLSEFTRWAFNGGAEPSEVSNRSVAAAIDWAESWASRWRREPTGTRRSRSVIATPRSLRATFGATASMSSTCVSSACTRTSNT